jgi:hypothetical protein
VSQMPRGVFIWTAVTGLPPSRWRSGSPTFPAVGYQCRPRYGRGVDGTNQLRGFRARTRWAAVISELLRPRRRPTTPQCRFSGVARKPEKRLASSLFGALLSALHRSRSTRTETCTADAPPRAWRHPGRRVKGKSRKVVEGRTLEVSVGWGRDAEGGCGIEAHIPRQSGADLVTEQAPLWR